MHLRMSVFSLYFALYMFSLFFARDTLPASAVRLVFLVFTSAPMITCLHVAYIFSCDARERLFSAVKTGSENDPLIVILTSY